MLLMVEKGFRGEICHAIHRYAKANNKYTKDYNKSTTSSYLVYLDANNLYGWAVSQKLPVKGFKWVKKLSEFNSIEFDEHFIKNQDENSDKGYFLEVDVEYPKKLFNRLIRIFHFYLKERKAKNVTSLFATYKTRKSMLFT